MNFLKTFRQSTIYDKNLNGVSKFFKFKKYFSSNNKYNFNDPPQNIYNTNAEKGFSPDGVKRPDPNITSTSMNTSGKPKPLDMTLQAGIDYSYKEIDPKRTPSENPDKAKDKKPDLDTYVGNRGEKFAGTYEGQGSADTNYHGYYNKYGKMKEKDKNPGDK